MWKNLRETCKWTFRIILLLKLLLKENASELESSPMTREYCKLYLYGSCEGPKEAVWDCRLAISGKAAQGCPAEGTVCADLPGLGRVDLSGLVSWLCLAWGADW